MTREVSFYYFVTGLSVQLLLLTYCFAVVVPSEFFSTTTNASATVFMGASIILSPIAANLIAIGNKGLKAGSTRVINTVLCLPIPIIFILLLIF